MTRPSPTTSLDLTALSHRELVSLARQVSWMSGYLRPYCPDDVDAARADGEDHRLFSPPSFDVRASSTLLVCLLALRKLLALHTKPLQRSRRPWRSVRHTPRGGRDVR